MSDSASSDAARSDTAGLDPHLDLEARNDHHYKSSGSKGQGWGLKSRFRKTGSVFKTSYLDLEHGHSTRGLNYGF